MRCCAARCALAQHRAHALKRETARYFSAQRAVRPHAVFLNDSVRLADPAQLRPRLAHLEAELRNAEEERRLPIVARNRTKSPS